MILLCYCIQKHNVNIKASYFEDLFLFIVLLSGFYQSQFPRSFGCKEIEIGPATYIAGPTGTEFLMKY